jgi:hypothetical protein
VMKSIFFKLLLFAIATLTSFQLNAHDFEVDGIYYNVIDPSALTCGVCGLDENNSNNENPIIPSHVSFSGKNLTVIEIQERAFEETDIVSISLPSTCMSIGRSAFWRCSKTPFHKIC